MKKLLLPVAVLLCLSACTPSSDEQHQSPAKKDYAASSSNSEENAVEDAEVDSDGEEEETYQEDGMSELEAGALEYALEKNLPGMSIKERKKIYEEEKNSPTPRAIQIAKDINLYLLEHRPQSKYGPEYDSIEKAQIIENMERAADQANNPVSIEDYKMFENEQEREEYLKKQIRLTEIKVEKTFGHPLSQKEKDFAKGIAEADLYRSEQNLQKEKDKAKVLAPPELPQNYTQEDRAAIINKKVDELLQHRRDQRLPVSPEIEAVIRRETEMRVEIQEKQRQKSSNTSP